MARLSRAYALALLGAVPPADLARAALRRWRRSHSSPRRFTGAEVVRAAETLVATPRLLSGDPPTPLYARDFPDAVARFRERALRILDGEVELFGRWRRVGRGRRVDWQRDLDLEAPGVDPKPAWELGRAGHLVELAAAARLHPDLAHAARDEIADQMLGFLSTNPVGEGLHFRSPLEVAIRGVHWLAALELVGGPARFPEGFRQRLARALLEEGEFLSQNLEDGGVCPANHLLGDYVGLLARGLAVGQRRWVARALAGVRAEAARQVGDDGAHFEASTAYHRFALELLLIADRLGAGVAPTLRRMLAFLRGTLAPDGTEPGFGDSDDARLLPMVPRDPRDHAYLLGVGAALFGDARLRRPGPPPEELIWWSGAAGLAAWSALPPTPDAPAVSFPSGGLHVLRSRRLYLAMRAGSYGQHGVGGHAHNDQLSLVVHARGRALIVDPGTGSYTADPVVRDRFRGTAAHSTVMVDGQEQSPLFADRPFALPDRARTGPVTVEDLGELAALQAAHHGYLRLPARVRHQRRVTLYRALDALTIDDELDGRGAVPVEVRFHLAERARLGAGPATRARVAELDGRLGPLDVERAVEIGDLGVRAALVPRLGRPLEPRLDSGWRAPHFGRILQQGVVSWMGLLTLPQSSTLAVLLLP